MPAPLPRPFDQAYTQLGEYVAETIQAAYNIAEDMLKGDPKVTTAPSLTWLRELLKQYLEECGSPETSVGIVPDYDVESAFILAGVACGQVPIGECDKHGRYIPWEGPSCLACLAEREAFDESE